MTPPDPNAETLPPTLVRLPGPPNMPSNIGPPAAPTEPPTLSDLANRIAGLSDELNDPKGALHVLFARAETLAARRHEEVMRTLTTLANGLSEVNERVAKLEPKAVEHEAEIHLLKVHAGQQQ